MNLKANIKSAILQNDLHWVSQLVKEGVDINARYTRNETTLLISAAATGHVDIVKKLIEYGAVINDTTLDNYTAVMAACEWDHPDVTELLIDEGADINIGTIGTGRKTSFAASLEEGPDVLEENLSQSINGNLETKSLLKKEDGVLPGLSNKLPGGQEVGSDDSQMGIDIYSEPLVQSSVTPMNSEQNDEEPYGYTCLIYACANKNISLIHKLIEMGADVNAMTSNDETALSMACCNDYSETIVTLIEEGADPNTIIADDGQSILMWACEHGLIRLVKLLLEKDADINQVDKFNNTALSESAKNGHNLIVRMLLEKDIEINVINVYGKSPLMLAAQEGHVAIVEELLIAGADTDIKTNKGQNALLMAAIENRAIVVEKIINFKRDSKNLKDELSESLLPIIRMGHTSIIRKFLDEGANPYYHNENGVTALMEAAYNRENDIIKLLLDAGADPNDRDNEGATALIKASYEWPVHLQITDSTHGPAGDVMVSGGHTSEGIPEDFEVSPNPKDTEHCSITLKILLDAGANPNTYNNKGVSPLSQRIKARDEKGIRILIAGGVDSTKCTREGRLRTDELQILDNEFPGIAGLLKKQEFQGVGSIKEYDETGF